MLSDSPSKVIYDLASTTPIPDGYEVTFTYFDKAEVQVYLEGSDGKETQVDNENYTVDESDTTAAVIFIRGYAFPEGSEKLVIMRVVAYEQESDYRNGDKIDADKIERSLDLLTAMVQQIAETIDRTIQKPKSETGNIVLPSAEQRANMLLGFDEDGNFKPVLMSDIEQQLQQILEAKSDAEAAASSASFSASQAGTYLSETKTAWQTALAQITAAKDEVLQLIEEANLEKIQELTQYAEQLEASMTEIEQNVSVMVERITYSESITTRASANSLFWANKAIDAYKSVAAIEKTVSTFYNEIQTIRSDIVSRHTQIQGIQDDVTAKQAAVSSDKTSVESMKADVSTDRTAVQTMRDTALSYKNAAAESVEEISTLKTQISAIAATEISGIRLVKGNRIYKIGLYTTKRGKAYRTIEEDTTQVGG